MTTWRWIYRRAWFSDELTACKIDFGGEKQAMENIFVESFVGMCCLEKEKRSEYRCFPL